MPFPSPPWRMTARMWLSVFRVADTGRADRAAGTYGAAFVSYEEGSRLTYRELAVARLLDPLRRTVEITDIWVDSEESLRGGRSLWAIPKELADLAVEERRLGPASQASFTAAVAGTQVASGRFGAVPAAALVRTPYAASARQTRADGGIVQTPMRGSARAVPAWATWDFVPDGPLAFLHGHRPLVSLRLHDVRLTFG
jgi:acetoacetate decarboxylase